MFSAIAGNLANLPKQLRFETPSRDGLRIRRKYDYDRDQYDRGKRGLEGDMRTLPWFGPGRGHRPLPWFGPEKGDRPRRDWRGGFPGPRRDWRGGFPGPKRDRDPIKEMYREILQREADEEGFNYWADELSSGDMTLDEIRNAIVNSAEAQELQESGRSLRGDTIPPMDGDFHFDWVMPFHHGPKKVSGPPPRDTGLTRLQRQLQIQPDR